MRREMLAAAVLAGFLAGHARAQTLTAIETDWNATFAALKTADAVAANAAF
jgi:hypothetical protein